MAMKRPGGMGRGMLSLQLKTIEELYAAYLGFLKNGGLFVATEKNYQLGDEVFMLVNLPEESEKIPVAGKVVWINPKGAQGSRPQGIGIQFGELDNGATRSKIESMLAGKAKSDARTHTM